MNTLAFRLLYQCRQLGEQPLNPIVSEAPTTECGRVMLSWNPSPPGALLPRQAALPHAPFIEPTSLLSQRHPWQSSAPGEPGGASGGRGSYVFEAPIEDLQLPLGEVRLGLQLLQALRPVANHGHLQLVFNLIWNQRRWHWDADRGSLSDQSGLSPGS